MAKKKTTSQKKNLCQKDISNLTSLGEISKKYRRRNDLLEEISSLHQLLGAQELSNKKLIKDIENKDKEIEHLKSLLSKSVPVIGGVERIEVQEEEFIAEVQLKKLSNIAQNRDLTLEEARKFEIYSKVKNSVNKNRSIPISVKKLPNNIAKNDLLEIASNKEIESKENNES